MFQYILIKLSGFPKINMWFVVTSETSRLFKERSDVDFQKKLKEQAWFFEKKGDLILCDQGLKKEGDNKFYRGCHQETAPANTVCSGFLFK